MKPPTALPLRNPFKGTRDYLQSADVYDSLLEALAGLGYDPGAASDVRLLFKEFARKQLTAVFEGTAAPEGEPKAHFSARFEGTEIRAALHERDEPVSDRVPYDEERLVAAMEFDLDAKTVSLAAAADDFSDYSLSEVVVAMNKALHLRLFPGEGRKWLFTELKTTPALFRLPWSDILVHLETAFGVKLTKSAISVDGRSVGNILFSSIGG